MAVHRASQQEVNMIDNPKQILIPSVARPQCPHLREFLFSDINDLLALLLSHLNIFSRSTGGVPDVADYHISLIY